MKWIYGLLIIAMTVITLSLSVPVSAGLTGKVTREIIEETVDRLAKKSGKKLLRDSARKSASETLERFVKSYGDDVIKVIDDAGFELLESAPKYGDDVVEFALKASPKGRRAFAQNIPELLPLVRRVGVEALELEVKSPGLSIQVYKVFGDDAAKILAKSVPAEDIPRLLKYAECVDVPLNKKLLLKTYMSEGASLFKRIPAKLVLAVGLSASMLYGTHEVTKPMGAIKDVIENNQDIASSAVSSLFRYVSALVGIVLFLLLWSFGLMPWQRPRRQSQKKPPHSIERT